MDYTDLSDLEEGEILECESSSQSDTRCDDFKVESCSFHSLKKRYKSCDFQFKGNQESDLYICERQRDDYINKNFKNKWKFGEKVGGLKSNMSLIDLESISSEEEHKSDEENKYFTVNKKYSVYNERWNGRKKQSNQFYGTVEDIMSEIGETICRKSGCNYMKRISKDSQISFNKYSDKSYELWSDKTFSSHIKNKKHKRNISFSDTNSDSDAAKERAKKRKKERKKREVIYEEEKKSKKTSQVRDFDEVRRTLLEKLKKQKAEEKSKASTNECPLEIENSEIQEVDMLIDCTNYVDDPRDAVPEDSAGEARTEENEREDELDLIKLRLIALASNNQRRKETVSKNLKTEEDSEKKSLGNSNEEVDLDRNELLLRAEALKTALLKKHQKRLSRLKVKKTENFIDKDGNSTVRSINCLHSEKINGDPDEDACKENVEKESDNKETGNFNYESNSEVKINELNEAPSEPSGNLKKTHSKSRTKRKKKKCGSFSNNVKENNDRSEAFEEDDRTLRSQLLDDLMKKKSLKEEKPVLLESIQASTNQPPPSVINCQPAKENEKPLPVTRKASLKKVNLPKTVKPLMGAVIPKAEIQRIIVHLGSEDSSDDDSPCQAPSAAAVGNQEEEKECKDVCTKLSQGNKAIHADYERSVELLLSQARKKIEGGKRTAEEKTLATPEAVYKHLPPSQRLEYIRLKQKIAERERLRKEKAENSGTFASVDSKALTNPTKGISHTFKSESGNVLKPPAKPVASSSSTSLVYKTASKPVLLHTPSCNKTKGHELKAREANPRIVLNKTIVNLQGVRGKELPTGREPKPGVSFQCSRLLLPSSQALISKLKLLLKKIKIEKIIEENYEKEMIKLKNQLSLLEKKKNEQRFKIKKLGEESIKTYKAIQGITTKTNEKTAPKEEEEEGEEGACSIKEGKTGENKPELKEETEGKKMSHEPEMELSKAQSETDKRPNNGDKTSETGKETTHGVCLMEYQSPLDVFNKASYCSERVDPNVMMCQFDLTGVCKDEECAYQHLHTLVCCWKENCCCSK